MSSADAGDEDREQRQRRARPGRDRGDRPPGQHRHLGAEHAADQRAQRARLLLDAGEALDHRHVAERIRDAFGEIGMEDVDRALQALGPAQDESHHHPEDEDEAEQHRAEPPVDREREGQQQGERDEARAMLAKEGLPEPHQAGRSLDHHLEQPAGMGARVETQRQMEDMIEIGGHRRQPLAMREPVGVQRDQHAGPDREQREADPGGEQGEHVGPARRRPRGMRAREPVDDPPEQDGFGELRGGEREIGEDEGRRQAPGGAQLRENAGVEADEGHRGLIGEAKPLGKSRAGCARAGGPACGFASPPEPP